MLTLILIHIVYVYTRNTYTFAKTLTCTLNLLVGCI